MIERTNRRTSERTNTKQTEQLSQCFAAILKNTVIQQNDRNLVLAMRPTEWPTCERHGKNSNFVGGDGCVCVCVQIYSYRHAYKWTQRIQ